VQQSRSIKHFSIAAQRNLINLKKIKKSKKKPNQNHSPFGCQTPVQKRRSFSSYRYSGHRH
jgi:hypothetical protein